MSDELPPVSTLRDSVDDESATAALKPHFFIVLEADRPHAGGARYALDDIEQILVQRGEERQAVRDTKSGRRRLVVSVPAPWMSSEHFVVTRDAGGWRAEDLGSKNGTLLGGARFNRAELEDGAVLEAGRAFFSLRVSLPAPAGWSEDADSSMMASLPVWQRTLFPGALEQLDALSRVAASNIPVLLLGESGTGKELVARAVHARSQRKGPFVPVNCGALPDALVEGLLFGHVKGAFSNAIRDELGLIRSADKGTLFLDEIGDLPLPAQASLLRALQEREVLPIGAARPLPVDTRVVCATHRDLDGLAARGVFRPDLLARLDGFRHALSPLRRRREDLGLLVATILARIAPGRETSVRLAPAAARALADHSWPGNVRELEQVLSRALALTRDGIIQASALAMSRPSSAQLRSAPPRTPSPESEALLREQLASELARHRGNVSEVARAMGKARMQVQRWMHRFQLDPESYRRSP